MRAAVWVVLCTAVCVATACTKKPEGPPEATPEEPTTTAPHVAVKSPAPSSAPKPAAPLRGDLIAVPTTKTDASAKPRPSIVVKYVDAPPPVTGPPSGDLIRGKRPAGFAQLRKATLLEVSDQWNGMGPTRHVVIRLKRKGAQFTFEAKVTPMAGGLGERIPDPNTPKGESPPCVCAVDKSCACEHARNPTRKSGSVAASVVESFLGVVAAYAIDPNYKDERRRRRWTDDYPKGHVAVWIPGRKAPIHLSFLDQRRHWRANGKYLKSEPPGEVRRTSHPRINAAFKKMLNAIGLKKWTANYRRGRGL